MQGEQQRRRDRRRERRHRLGHQQQDDLRQVAPVQRRDVARKAVEPAAAPRDLVKDHRVEQPFDDVAQPLHEDDLPRVGGDVHLHVFDDADEGVDRRHQDHHPEGTQAAFERVVEMERRGHIAQQELDRALAAARDFGRAQHRRQAK